MDKNALVFAKSAKGRDALNAASRELPLNDRRLLIMIDGRHSVGELMKQVGAAFDVEAVIEQLFLNGYILPAAGTASGGAAAPDKGAAGLAALSDKAKALIERELVDLVGPIASLLCEETLPKAATVNEAVLKLSAQLDANQAKQFKEKILAGLARL